MKKVIFNKYVKLLEMLCIMVVACILLWEGISIIQIDKDNDDKQERLYEEMMDYDEINSNIYAQIAPYINDLILAHKNGGMQALADAVATDTEMWNRINVSASDGEMIYKKGIEPRDLEYQYWYEVDIKARGYQEVEILFNEYHNYAGCSILVNDKISIKNFDDHAASPGDISKSELLSDEAIAYMDSIDNDLHIAVYSTYPYVDEVSNEYWDRYNEAVEQLIYEDLESYIIANIPMYIALGMIIVILTILLVISCGRGVEEKKILNAYEKGYSEIHIALIILILGGLVFGGVAFLDVYYELPLSIDATLLKAICAAFLVAMALGIAWLYYELGIIIKKLINKRFIKDWFIARVFLKLKRGIGKVRRKIAASLKNNYDASAYANLPKYKRAFINKVISDVCIAIAAIIILIEVCTDDIYYMAEMLFVMIWIFIIFYFVKSFMEYAHLRKDKRITDAIDSIYNGDYSQIKPDENEKDGNLIKLANLSNSFEESVRKQVEAEKMQVELVANVSHDLKTPLTSIISYVDLLKEEEMSDVAKDYVRVLIEKSARLKDIVSDVFDLAKATSGEQVQMEQLDGIVLINQVLSDMSDRIEETGRDLRVKLLTDTAAINGNGQKLYRVFQNVIDNALKYSMAGTRIYLQAEEVNGEFKVTVKNVSEYEIDFTADEIMSRFTRGDKARHSEGNGLGLSIAKSFTEICGGTFEVKLDDDVFMVIIKLK